MKSKLLVLLLAAAMTAANALKSPVIDDTAYLAIAQQIAKAPLDPYGFEQFWYQQPQPANEVLAPPVLPYWLGLGMRVVGDDPVWLKLWLFPVALVFCFSLHKLLRRFARGAETAVLVMTAFSPAILPAFDFMLDVPAYALGLTALVIFLRALDRQSVWLAVAAGVVAALAAQTKYTGILAAPAIVACSLVRRRAPLGAVSGGVAIVLFAGWELFTRAKYGASHFLFALNAGQTSWEAKLDQAGPLFLLLGGVAPPVAMVGLTALRLPWVVSAGFAALVAGGYAVIASGADPAESSWAPRDGTVFVPVAGPTFAILGAVTVGIVLIVVLFVFLRRLRRPAAEAAGRRGRRRQRRERLWARLARQSWVWWFLVVWLLIELAGYFGMAQFPAVRRVMGLTLVATIIVARLAAARCRERRRWAVWAAVAPGIALGLFYESVDISDSRVEPEAARQAAAFIRNEDSHATVWFTGHWGFQYETIKQGMKPVVPGRSLLQAGDWLVAPEPWLPQQLINPAPQLGEPVHVVRVTRQFPLRTVPAYYGGRLPMDTWRPLRLAVGVFRVNAACVPEQP